MKKTEKMLCYPTGEGREIQIPVVTLEGGVPAPMPSSPPASTAANILPFWRRRSFAATCDLQDIRGTVTVVTISTLESFRTRTPFVCPVDGKNPNRCFPGDLTAPSPSS